MTIENLSSTPANNTVQVQQKKIDYPEGLKPTLIKKVWRVVFDVLSVVILPLFAMRLVLKYAIVSSSIPFGIMAKPKLLAKYRKDLLERPGAERITIKTCDNVKLDGVFIKGNKHPDKAIVLCSAGTNYYEKERSRIDLFLESGCSVLVFNPRSVGKSDFRLFIREEELGFDVYSAAQYLVQEKGIAVESQVLWGSCMGASRMLVGAEMLQRNYPIKSLNIVHERSFSLLWHQLAHYTGKILGRIIAIFARCFGFDLNGVKGMRNIHGKKLIITHRKDEKVLPPAQMLTALKGKQSIGYERIDLEKRNTVIEKKYRKPCHEATKHLFAYKNEIFQNFAEMLNLPES